MPKISLSIPHQLGQEEAKERISRLIAENRGKSIHTVSDLAESWNGYVETFRFRARGFSFSGKLEVEAARIVVDVTLPLAAFLYKGRIEEELLARARQLLA